IAVNSTGPPVADRDDVEPPSTSAAAEGWISESLTLPFPAKPKLASIRRTSESVKLVALALTSMPPDVVVRLPSRWTRPGAPSDATAAIRPAETRPPKPPPFVLAVATFPPLRVLASTVMLPEPDSAAEDPTVVWMPAPDVMVAEPTPPLRPMTETPTTRTLAVAVWSAIELTRIVEAFETEPLTVVDVWPEMTANASSTEIEMPPPAPPGASASAELLDVAWIAAGAGVVNAMFAVELSPASVERELLTRAPAALPPSAPPSAWVWLCGGAPARPGGRAGACDPAARRRGPLGGPGSWPPATGAPGAAGPASPTKASAKVFSVMSALREIAP